MKFVDNLLELYDKHFEEKDHLSIFTKSVVEQLDKEDLLHVLADCNKEELSDLVTLFVLEELERRNRKVIPLYKQTEPITQSVKTRYKL
ncbi:DUF6154 family protein [Pontibacillus salicampi]|uniref:DUF6154 family protein n=1 Tax=Pontibacillus salicampi TaxID=1449801 RepID=A0ABV6LNF9_9BACI